jgi:hypothetical protein
MAVTKLNYVPGEFEAVTAEASGVITFGASQYFVLLDSFKFVLADVAAYADGVLMLPSEYTLYTDVKYTNLESTRSTKTLYAKIEVTNAAHDGKALTVDGNNFGSYTDNEAVDEVVNEGIAGKRDIVHGFVDPDGVVFSFDDSTRVMTYTHPSGYVEFWAGKILYKIANGDARLTTTTANANEPSWLYFDIDGQLKYKTTLDWVDVKVVCLAHLAKYDVDLYGVGVGGYILTIGRWEDCQANHVENYASYRSKGVQGVKGEGIGFTGIVGDTQTGYNAASYLSARDFEFAVPSLNFDAISWLRYHYDGADDTGQYRIKLSVSPAPTGSPIIRGTEIGLAGTNAVYNIYDSGTDSFTVAECPSNDFVIGHLGVGDGGSQKVISLAPQGKYSTLNDAVEAMETEVAKLTGDDAIFRDVAVTTSFIVKGNLVGGFLPVDAAGNAFYYHSISAQGGGGTGANNQSYDDVLGIDPTTDKDAVHTDGSNTTAVSTTSVVISDSSGYFGTFDKVKVRITNALNYYVGLTSNAIQGYVGTAVAKITCSASRVGWDIDSPSTTEIDAANATRGAGDSKALPSFGGLKETTSVAAVAGANITINTDSTTYNAADDDFNIDFSVGVGGVARVAVIVTLGAASRPPSTHGCVITSVTDGTVYGGRIAVDGTLKCYSALAEDTYKAWVSYNR